MKKELHKIIIALMLFIVPRFVNGQITLGAASQFVLFTTVGPVTNSGTNFETRLTGKVGSNSGSSTGFANVDGTMHSGDVVTIAAAANLATAYTQLNTAAATMTPSSSMGGGATFVPGVYSIPTAASLTGTLTLDGQGNAGSVFIIKINGAFSVAPNSKVKLINGALACNVYWKTEGLTSIGSGSTMRGTIVANNGAIAFGTLDTLEGRALSINGQITMNSLTAAMPIGCGSPTLTGPAAPTYGAVGIFAIFSGNGPVTNGGSTAYVVGDIGTNLGLTTGYNPLLVNGTIHPIPDGATTAAAPALTGAYGQLHALPDDIELLYPALLGHNMTLTPHTYILKAATALTDTLYLDAQGNSNAVFVIKINGALNTTPGAAVKLLNGTRSKNVYWKVAGAVDLVAGTVFRGDLVVTSGAIDVKPGAKLFGRALTTIGAINTNGDSMIAPLAPYASITGDSTVCVGSSTTPYIGMDPGGVWSVTNPRASITNLGILTGVSAGFDTVVYTVTNSFGTATANKVVNVKPLPNAGTISGPSSVCVGSSITLTSSGSGGVWTASNATATVVNGVVTGITAGIDTIKYTVVNSCGTSTATKIINIFAVPSVNATANQTVCNGAPTTAVNYTGTVVGTTYAWTNNTTSIGLAASGNGNIASFTATNITAAPVVATITVTPSANGCTGSSKNFTITVNPSPNVTTVPNQAVCNGAPTNAVNYSGTVSGTTYSWTNNTTSIGLAGTGNGNIASFTATNSTSAPVVATVIVTPSANGCSGSTRSFTITVNPTPTAAVANQTVCNGAPTTAVNYTGTVVGTTYAWTNNTTSIGLAGTGNGNIASFTATNITAAPVVATITVTPSANGCTGSSKNFTITVNPSPNVTTVPNQAVCNGAPTNAVNYSGTVSGTTYSWTNNTTSIGLAGTGNGNIASFTATNSTSAPVVATVIVTPSANGCTGSTRSFTITVNPTPTAAAVANQVVCNATPTTAVNYTGTVSGTTFAWTNNTTSIGLAGTGNGNIAPFTATNSTTAPVTATIIVTPSANGCTGSTRSFTITVNPTPAVTAVANQTVCNNAPTTAVTYTGTVSGTTYSWTNNNTSIGLAGTGNGNIPSFTATNSTTTPAVATIVVAPSANGCTGSTKNFTITVNPTPTVSTVANQVVCKGASTTAVNFAGPVTGTTYSWTNNNTSVGLGANGNGNIPSFISTNGTNAPITATVTATPSANGCAGSTRSFTITVNPTPNATVSNQVVCNGAQTAPVVYTSLVTGTAFAWTNNNTSIGLAGSGAGNIAAFTALNSSSIPVIANITVTPTANGCTGPFNSFSITVNPTPNVVATADQVVCNGAPTTSVVYTGSVSGTTYSWTNNNNTTGLASSGNGNIPSFSALNITNAPIMSRVIVTPSANSCTGLTDTFNITVNPTPTVTAIANQDVCNGLPTMAVNFTGPVSGSGFTWTNNNTSIGLGATGITNIASFVALNSTSAPVVATIIVSPSANGCSGPTRSFTITVNPTPDAPVLSLTTPSSVCDKTYFRNFGAATLPPAGMVYSWSTVNAAISDTGSTTQYALVNFKIPGAATVILTSTVANTGCLNEARYNVDVTNNIADTPAQVIYFNKSFVCLQNNEEAYAWGYDDAYTLAPTSITGALNQDYVNATPDFVNNRYWVMVTHNGCIQKTYYNKPEEAQMKQLPIAITVSPNPASQQIEVGVNTINAGGMQMEIYNMLGRKMYTTSSITNNATVDISSFPAGVYVIICNSNGEKITARFIKN